jgi:predicted dehydrogenase
MSFRWGIAGTGRIASDFVDGLRQVPDAEVVAVCSRSSESAREFANRRAIARDRKLSDAAVAAGLRVAQPGL